MSKALAVFVLGGFMVVACAGVGMPRPTDADAMRAGGRWPGTTVGQLDHGRELYMSHCSACHQPVDPRKFAAAEWPVHVNEMRDRAKLSPDEADLVIRYLMTMADGAHQPAATASAAK